MAQALYEPLVFDSIERTYQQLSCANCGEPLQMSEKGGVLTCELCGQGHKSLPPPPRVKTTDFAPGDGVAVLWGERWWSAHVTEVMDGERWRVHYEGWAPSFDEVVGKTRIRPLDYVPGSSIIPPVFEPTLKVKRANLLSAAGIVMAVLAGIAFLLFWGLGDQVFNVHSKQTVGVDSASFGSITGRIPGTYIDDKYLIQPDQTFYVKWGDGWYVGTVVDVITQNQIVIRYDGWGNEQNEVVTRNRLRAIP